MSDRRAMSSQRVTHLQPGHLKGSSDPKNAFSLDVLVGLSETLKRIPSGYLYDNEGSRIFQEITTLEEYYPTRIERDILEDHRDSLARAMGEAEFNLVELGPGDGHKTAILLQRLIAQGSRFRYIPIDISEGAMEGLSQSSAQRFPNMPFEGIVAEYFDGLKWLLGQNARPNRVLFMGSNIGNFHKNEALLFLRSLWNALNPGDSVLIGFDLKKDINALMRAYNDSLGVTARFNLNLLSRINRELGGRFDTSKFEHYATYSVASGAMESYLVSREPQTVFIEAINRSFDFDAWEPIHTEYSYKYLNSDIESLAQNVGFIVENHYFDRKRWFDCSLWRVQKER